METTVNQPQTRNESTLRALVQKQGNFEFIYKEKDKQGIEHTFAKIGTVIAYPSSNVQKMLLDEGIAAVDKIVYKEFLCEDPDSKHFNQWIGCLVSNEGGLKATLKFAAADL